MNDNSRILKRRKELNMTLEEVGKIVGVGKSTVRNWENGMIANMGRDKVVLLAKALRVDPDFILGFTPEVKTLLNTLVAVPIHNELHYFDLMNAKLMDHLK